MRGFGEQGEPSVAPPEQYFHGEDSIYGTPVAPRNAFLGKMVGLHDIGLALISTVKPVRRIMQGIAEVNFEGSVDQSKR